MALTLSKSKSSKPKSSKPKSSKPSKSAAKPASPAKPAPSAKPASPAKPAKPASPTKPAKPTAPAKPAPATIEAVAFQLSLLGANGPQVVADQADEYQVSPPTLFAAVPVGPVAKRYLYLVQQQTTPKTGLLVLMLVFDTHDAAPARVPPLGAWQRAIVTGSVHVLASDLQLSRADLVAWLGGHEPPPTKAQPPFT